MVDTYGRQEAGKEGGREEGRKGGRKIRNDKQNQGEGGREEEASHLTHTPSLSLSLYHRCGKTQSRLNGTMGSTL